MGTDPISSIHVNTERPWRGGEQQTLSLVAGLRRRGHGAVLVASPRGELFQRARAAGLEPVGIHALNEVDPLCILRLAMLLRRLRPQILHLHTSHAHTLGVLAAILAPPVRCIVSRRVDISIFKKATLHLSGIKYRHGVDRYIAVSSTVGNLLEREGVQRSRISVVHSGVDPARFDPPPAADPEGLLREQSLPPGLPLVVSVGALAKHKGHRVLLEAAARVLRRRDAAFILAGEGPLRRSLEDQAQRLGIADRLRLSGFRADVGRLIAAAAVFVFPSLGEGLGTSLMDALLLECPVVASTAGGIPEIITHGEQGLLVPPGDPEALAAAILEVLGDPRSGIERARRGRLRVLEEFSADRMVEGTLAVYREILQ